MVFRHEWKIEINPTDLFVLRQRLRAIAKPDPHAVNGKYFIRSLYFETPTDKALREKIDGVNRREKFRFRYYNHDSNLIRLEKKSKLNGLCNKQMIEISAEQAQKIIDGDLSWMRSSKAPLIQELNSKMAIERLQPKVIVDYTREPFVYPPGNVRITFDYNIRTGLNSKDFLNPDCVMIPAGDAPILMEVKWDAFMPNIIRDAIRLKGRRAAAFSKYAQCRIYG